MKRKILTLCFVVENGKVLLGMKKRGFGAGRWNGFGGKVEQGETIEAAAKREISEEVGLSTSILEDRGQLDFSFENKPGEILEVHIFLAREWNGTPAESEEMKPEWFAFDAVPYDTMWPDDHYWLPQFLSGKKVFGSFHFGENDVVLKNEVRFE